MKSTLEFNLPEDTEEFKLAQNGWQYKIVIDELDNWLRGKIKYTELNKDQEMAYRLARQHLNDLLTERNL